LRKKYTFTNEEICRVREFAQKIISSDSQARRSFGSNVRTENESVSDTFQGKLAEVAFVKFAQQFGAVVSVDYDIYPDHYQIDFGQDIDQIYESGKPARLIPRIDIKASRNYSKWLLIEHYKFWADAYVFIKVKIPQELRSDINKIKPESGIEAEVAGFAYHFDIIDPKTKSPWFQFNQNARLFDPDPLLFYVPKHHLESPQTLSQWIDEKNKNKELTWKNVYLKCSLNFGLPEIWLRSSDEDWSFFINWIKSSTINNDDILPNDFDIPF
jgi:hypothetical protein